MATIRVCDWTKRRLSKGDATYSITIDNQTFEVGEEGKKFILSQLEGELEIESPKQEAPQPRNPAPEGLIEGSNEVGLDLPSSDEPFGESEKNVAPQTEDVTEDMPAFEIPEDVKKGLKMPPKAVADKIMKEATKFEEGSLPSLTVGSKKQKNAQKKLRELEEAQELKLKRKAGKDIRLNSRINDLI